MDRRVERYDAYRALLAKEDPPGLPRRARRYLLAGDPLKRDRIKLELERAYVRHRMLDAGHEAVIVSVRRMPLRLVRRREGAA